MKKVFLGIIAASLLVACNSNSAKTNQASNTDTVGSAATKAGATVANVPAGDLPAMKFEHETHDFGKIKGGDLVHYDFKFTNTGKSPLIITNATATCGCTKPEFPKTPVAPGASDVIKVTFNSAGKMGLQDKQITITANTNPAETRVHLIGDVTNPTSN
ncbi:DUF1573 domain-containing protein [Mucilaginibacter polytrichastri]|uniref:DUF1573 domain-containing protein n=1 Tax=Mucilaginibacter polytrichastri TaxID=1302689 RepID=A0A1Q5ZUP4_9SPHI|nr:DUF1573 domain-containing protein [Mucilaginibacter polytrichastri]OKS85443.1 hypothetical protein RG47T_0889 [Mucilaginibacter polytrichastri]SFS38779.1 Protein of unknown function [Mucilaginibacter polytrichastri]